MLTPGTRIGAFEILSALGAGGMGEVYRARDTRLHRDVALKVLPADVAGDAERLSRFEREARTLATLNHPHIAQVYGVEHGADDALGALVMELVEGDDLSARIGRGPLTVEATLAIARQIADALDAAHAAGIVHRDLKPANIKVRDDETVKVLDFGLAKAGATPSGGVLAGATLLQTITSPAVTQSGVILGTAAYMSPEQARGKAVDKRTDIWAFGCVVYEMLTGTPAFDGDTATDVLGAIVKTEPRWDALPPETPSALTRLLKRCLQKDAAKRLRDIGDARAEIEDIAQAPAAVATSPPALVARRTRPLSVVAWIATGIAIGVAAIAIAMTLARRPAAAAPVQKLSIAVGGHGLVREPSISPDGTKVVFVAPAKARLSVRALDQWAPRELEGTEGAVRPFWSPDSQWIGYFRNEQLMKVPADGGPVVRVATLPAVQVPLRISSGAWTDDGYITISNGTGGLMRVPAGGGELTAHPVQPAENLVIMDVRPLPSGALLARLRGIDDRNSIVVITNETMRSIYAGGEVRRPTYAPPGYVVFAGPSESRTMWALPVDPATMSANRDAFVIGAGGEPSIDNDGTLAFVPIADVPRDLAWFDLDGRVGPGLAEPRQWIEGVAVSPDGHRVLASASDGIWAYDAETGARSRVTRGSYDITPQWVDANTIVFVRSENLEPVLVLKDLRASGTERVLARRARFPRVTADGRRIVFNLQDASRPSGWMVAWIDLDSPDAIGRLPDLHFGARFPSVSPDGTLVAYVSSEVGRDEIYLTRLPSGEGKWQISTSGGGWTLFHPSGTSIVYRTPDNVMMSVPVTNGEEVKVGLPRKLFDWGGAWAPFYDFARDGKRGITALPLENAPPLASISIVENWWREFR
jgi:Tol biopolymer transport system component